MVLPVGIWRGPAVTRRHVLQWLGAVAVVTLQPGVVCREVRAATRPLAPYGFLNTDELAILDAAADAILPTDDLPGAREIGIVDYVQSLLSYMPGSDANCDRYVNAADVTAVEGKLFGQYVACPDGGDVNGDGTVGADDVRAAEVAAFRARPMFAAGPFSGRHPQPHFPVGATSCGTCHGPGGGGGMRSTAGVETVDVYPPAAFRQFLPMNRLQRCKRVTKPM